MSAFISEPIPNDEHQVATLSHGNPDHFSQQRHDSSFKSPGTSDSVTMSEHKEPEVEVHISAGQKMLSAVSGALLTSLLGNPLHP